MNLPKVTIQIVTWNSMKYLPSCLESIYSQTYRDFQVLVVDNNSSDGTVEFIRNNYPEVAVFQNKKNMGFARANNQGIRLLHSPYILFCNQDIVLESTFLEKIMEKAESPEKKDIGSLGGKLLKLKLVEGIVAPEFKTNIIDSCGLKILKNRRVVEIGAGEKSVNYSKEEEVFGHSGALVLYKRETLDDCKIKIKSSTKEEYFDEYFFSYKEDVDLAWRSRLLGWKSIFVPSAVAYHVRSLSGSEKISVSQMMKNRKKQSSFARYYSYRNHLLLLMKNEFGKNILKNFWRIKWFEIRKAVYIIFFEFKSIRAWLEIIKMMPQMLAKRKEIFNKSKVNYNDIAKWIK